MPRSMSARSLVFSLILLSLSFGSAASASDLAVELSPLIAETGLVNTLTVTTSEPTLAGPLVIDQWSLDPRDGEGPALEHVYLFPLPWNVSLDAYPVFWTRLLEGDQEQIIELDDQLQFEEGPPRPSLLLMSENTATAGTTLELTVELSEHPIAPSSFAFGELHVEFEAVSDTIFILSVEIPIDALDQGEYRNLEIRWPGDLIEPLIAQQALHILPPVPVILGATLTPDHIINTGNYELELQLEFDGEPQDVQIAYLHLLSVISLETPEPVEPGLWRFSFELDDHQATGEIRLSIIFVDERIPPLTIEDALIIEALPPRPTFGGISKHSIQVGESETVRLLINDPLPILDIDLGDLVVDWRVIEPNIVNPYNIELDLETTPLTEPGQRDLVVTFDNPHYPELVRAKVINVVGAPIIETQIASISPQAIVAGVQSTIEILLEEEVTLASITLGTFATTLERDDTDPKLWRLHVDVPSEAQRRSYTLTLTQQNPQVDPLILMNAIGVIDPPPTDWQLSPSELLRGATHELQITGPSVSALQGVQTSSPGVAILNFSPSGTDGIAALTIQLSDNAPAGPIELIMQTSSGDESRDDLITARPGPAELFFLTPDTLIAGAPAASFELRGRNLDTLDSLESSADISVSLQAGGSPTRRQVELSATADAGAGPRPLLARVGDVSVELQTAFSVIVSDIRVTSVTPSTIERGNSEVLLFQGAGLGEVDEVAAAGRLNFEEIRDQQPDSFIVDVFAREDATLGNTPILLLSGDELIDVQFSVQITPEPTQLSRLRPSNLYRDEQGSLIIEGRSLDGVTSVDLGDDVSIDSFEAISPTRLVVNYSVQPAAELGFRDVQLLSEHGDVQAEDALTIGEVREPMPELSAELSVEFDDTEVGAIRLYTLEITNDGQTEETLIFDEASGDYDILHFSDPLRPIEELTTATITIGPGETNELTLRYAPTFRAQSAASFQVSARDGEFILEPLVLRGASLPRAHHISPAPPIRFGPWPVGEITDLTELSLTANEDSAAMLTTITALQAFTSLDGRDLIPEEIGLHYQLVGSDESDAPLWHQSKVSWSVQVPAGLVSGAIILETTSETAPLVPFEFSIRSSDESSSDDLNGDAWHPDAGGDVDHSDASDAATDPDTDEADADDTELSGGSGGGSDGCCSVTGSSAPMNDALLALLVLALIRRRRAQPGS